MAPGCRHSREWWPHRVKCPPMTHEDHGGETMPVVPHLKICVDSGHKVTSAQIPKSWEFYSAGKLKCRRMGTSSFCWCSCRIYLWCLTVHTVHAQKTEWQEPWKSISNGANVFKYEAFYGDGGTDVLISSQYERMLWCILVEPTVSERKRFLG